MAVKSLIAIGFLLVCCLLEVSSRPNNEFDPDGTYLERSSGSRKADIFNYDGEKFIEALVMDANYVLRLNPVADAVSGSKGVAIANPQSHVAIRREDTGTIVHEPQASAVVGPGGIAHAQSDLFLYDYITNENVGDGLSL